MGPGGAASAPIIPVKAKKSMTEEEREMIRIYERERHKRYATGTLVVATANFCAEKVQDMSFRVHEEMTLMKPMADLCWYYAQKVENPSVKGVIPITHVRLVYMSDDEDEDQIYNKPKAAGHDKLYDDRNDFISNSGWFQFPGLPLGKEAQLNVLAKKAGLSYDSFISTKRAVYVLSYRQEK
ncbi:PREDICTED: uncharacterized protein LOC109593544, partial [Amphimedon queenslandica]|uniref:Uncharacterized protein n=1 Tax=Amphimedon queenslandica TaxID=400682 RepID=A0AAN0K3N4_AMPQE